MTNPLTTVYKPRHLCADLVEIKNNGLQLGLYMALVLGHKPLLDDWIRKNRLAEFIKACRGYGIHVRQDVAFRNVGKDTVPATVLGRERLTTTCAYAKRPGEATDEEVHVFLSKDKNVLKKAMWYPVIVNNRVIFAPRADHLKYGTVLGYPSCCIRFFRARNDWTKYSHLYEAMRNTNGKFQPLCNPLLKDTIYSYIYHMPCRYDCPQTQKLAGRLRKAILKHEPGYVKRADDFLSRPYLVFYERKFYGFQGSVDKKGLLRYRSVFFPCPDTSKNILEKDLAAADALKMEGRACVLFKKNKIVKRLSTPLTDFAPEYPFLADFSQGRTG
ncbi:MAG: hypothetical protein WC732_04670 [Candidatus Omnitrophota bacterium]